MIIFINDIPVRILAPGEIPEPGLITSTIDVNVETPSLSNLFHHILLTHVKGENLDFIFGMLSSNVPTALQSLTLSIEPYEIFEHYLAEKFKIIKAAGGLIRKKNKFLMIYRLKKWDLPKGKKEKKETYRETAVREIEEECNVTVKIGDKICTTWHTYTMNKRNMLKKTKWYLMDVQDDSKMKPNQEEDIEALRWMSKKEVYHALEHSYNSIRHVFSSYYNNLEVEKE